MSVVCDNLPGSAEDEVKGVSTDEEDFAVRPPPRITSSGIFIFSQVYLSFDKSFVKENRRRSM